jgi:predicted nucleic acid-binding Zn ribbon protein
MSYKPKAYDHLNRKSDTSTVGEALQEMYKAYRLDGRFKSSQVVNSWERLMGKPIASRTEKIFLNNKKLYIKLTSAPLKQELSMSKQKIVEIFNREFGEGTIEEIVFN